MFSLVHETSQEQANEECRARPFAVKIGEVYAVMKAVQPTRVEAAFAELLEAAKHHLPAVFAELCIFTSDDGGASRPEMQSITKYGTYMTDGIAVCMFARPQPSSSTMPFTRRLAVVRCL